MRRSDGLYSRALKARMAELEGERARLAAQLEGATPAPPVALHPNLPELYRRQVERLEAALYDPLVRDEAAEVLRELIEKVVLLPRADARASTPRCMAISPASFSSARGRTRRADRANANSPARAGRGVKCRWLRGQDLPPSLALGVDARGPDGPLGPNRQVHAPAPPTNDEGRPCGAPCIIGCGGRS